MLTKKWFIVLGTLSSVALLVLDPLILSSENPLIFILLRAVLTTISVFFILNLIGLLASIQHTRTLLQGNIDDYSSDKYLKDDKHKEFFQGMVKSTQHTVNLLHIDLGERHKIKHFEINL
jgi:hypothetical protein